MAQAFFGDRAGERNRECNRCSRTRHSFRLEFSIEQMGALPHSDKAEGMAGFRYLWVEAGAVVEDLENNTIAFTLEARFDPGGVGVARNISQRFLKDAKDGGGPVLIENQRFHGQGYAALNSCAALKLLGLRFELGRQDKIVPSSRPH